MKFTKGKSGNPAGRPRGVLNLPEIRKLLAPHAPTFEAKLLELLNHEDGRVQMEALKLGYAYLYGKPLESVDHSASGRGSIAVNIELGPPEPESLDDGHRHSEVACGSVIDAKSQPGALPSSTESLDRPAESPSRPLLSDYPWKS
jgi:hypothetical protein